MIVRRSAPGKPGQPGSFFLTAACTPSLTHPTRPMGEPTPGRQAKRQRPQTARSVQPRSWGAASQQGVSRSASPSLCSGCRGRSSQIILCATITKWTAPFTAPCTIPGVQTKKPAHAGGFSIARLTLQPVRLAVQQLRLPDDQTARRSHQTLSPSRKPRFRDTQIATVAGGETRTLVRPKIGRR